MTKTYCDICGQELNFDYTRYGAVYDINTKWHEPHQTTIHSNGMTTQTLLAYFPPGDVNVTLCDKCGSRLVKAIKDKIEEIKNNPEEPKKTVVTEPKVVVTEPSEGITIEIPSGVYSIK